MNTLLKNHFCRMICLSILTIAVMSSAAQAKKVIVLGFDGTDANLLKQFMEEGALPNFSRLVSSGDFSPLRTSDPPQSPVAWSTFITGMDPGGHGIYDFVHRDPKTYFPIMSMAEAVPSERTLSFGSWVIPLTSGKVESHRHGRAFWELLGEYGIPTTVFRIPVNFPPTENVPKHKSFSGMGTPDITGSPRTFSYYTTKMPSNAKDFSGGKAYQVRAVDNTVEAKLHGPTNPFRRFPQKDKRSTTVTYENPECELDFQVYLDPERKVAKFVVGSEEFILKEKEWSDWIPVTFEGVPYFVPIHSIARFYLKEIAPEFKLYVSPLQIDPANPAMPISAPAGWAKELCEKNGPFYTQGLPADTNALQCGVFDGPEFLENLLYICDENFKLLKNLLADFHEGFFFYYFNTLDQGSHMLWRYGDKEHPGFVDEDFMTVGIKGLYKRMDEELGYVLDHIDKDTVVIAMSDHGFAPFYWGINLNTWLYDKGYIARNITSRRAPEIFPYVIWRKTKAYALGLNGVYVNLKGRERDGIISPGKEYNELLDQLKADLLAMRDPRTGKNPISRVVCPQREFHGEYKDDGPDIIVGFNRGYRISWDSPLGKFPKDEFVDNIKAWSGDHCADSRVVPGILVTNQKITLENPALYDVTVAILDEFGVKPLPEMIGKDCLESKIQESAY